LCEILSYSCAGIIAVSPLFISEAVVIMGPSTGKSLALKCWSTANQNKSSIYSEIPLRNTNQSANERTGVLLESNIRP